jgi:hypothetical protein
MLDDLVELATGVIHEGHSPELGSPAVMPPRRRRGSKSQSVSSSVDDTNGMPPPAQPLSKSPSPAVARHRRTPSAATPDSPKGRPRLADALVTRPKIEQVDKSVVKFVATTALSLVFSGSLRYLAAGYTTFGRAELGNISRRGDPEDFLFIGGLLLWRVLSIAVYWFGGYDGM